MYVYIKISQKSTIKITESKLLTYMGDNIQSFVGSYDVNDGGPQHYFFLKNANELLRFQIRTIENTQTIYRAYNRYNTTTGKFDSCPIPYIGSTLKVPSNATFPTTEEITNCKESGIEQAHTGKASKIALPQISNTRLTSQQQEILYFAVLSKCSLSFYDFVDNDLLQTASNQKEKVLVLMASIQVDSACDKKKLNESQLTTIRHFQHEFLSPDNINTFDRNKKISTETPSQALKIGDIQEFFISCIQSTLKDMGEQEVPQMQVKRSSQEIQDYTLGQAQKFSDSEIYYREGMNGINKKLYDCLSQLFLRQQANNLPEHDITHILEQMLEKKLYINFIDIITDMITGIEFKTTTKLTQYIDIYNEINTTYPIEGWGHYLGLLHRIRLLLFKNINKKQLVLESSFITEEQKAILLDALSRTNTQDTHSNDDNDDNEDQATINLAVLEKMTHEQINIMINLVRSQITLTEDIIKKVKHMSKTFSIAKALLFLPTLKFQFTETLIDSLFSHNNPCVVMQALVEIQTLDIPLSEKIVQNTLATQFPRNISNAYQQLVSHEGTRKVDDAILAVIEEAIYPIEMINNLIKLNISDLLTDDILAIFKQRKSADIADSVIALKSVPVPKSVLNQLHSHKEKRDFTQILILLHDANIDLNHPLITEIATYPNLSSLYLDIVNLHKNTRNIEHLAILIKNHHPKTQTLLTCLHQNQISWSPQQIDSILDRHSDLTGFIKALGFLRDGKVTVTPELFNTLISHSSPARLAFSYALSTQYKSRIDNEDFFFTSGIKKQSKMIIAAFDIYIRTGNTEPVKEISREVLRGQLLLIAKELSILKTDNTLDLTLFHLEKPTQATHLTR